MPLRHRLLAALVAICWGLNFPATTIALEHFPPFLMVALRFVLIAIPTVLFIPRPKIQFRWLFGVGLGIGLLQFGFLYLGMAMGMPGGLASLVLQASAPFTVLIAAFGLGERVSRRQLIGIVLAVGGLATIAAYRAQVAAFLPVALTLAAALGWAIGNICSRQASNPEHAHPGAGPLNPLHLTLWMSVVPPLPIFALSLLVEGPQRIGQTMAGVATRNALPSVLGLLYIVVIATVVGYGLWNWLLSRHPSSVVAPFSMLVPIVGVLSSWLAFGELIAPIELVAGLAVVGGVLYASRPTRPAPAPDLKPVTPTLPTPVVSNR